MHWGEQRKKAGFAFILQGIVFKHSNLKENVSTAENSPE